MKEIWKEIKGYEGLYWISNYGKIKSLKCSERKAFKNNKGYYIIRLSKNGVIKSHSVHRLVAQAFINNPYKLECVNHIDNNPSNNYYKNLEWCTMSYNTKYAISQGRLTHHIENCIKNNKKKQKKVAQYDMNNNLIKVYDSMSSASKSINSNKGAISKCCNGKLKSVNGYIWKLYP